MVKFYKSFMYTYFYFYLVMIGLVTEISPSSENLKG